MQPLALTETPKIIAALAVGIVFGFLLVQSQVAFRKTLVDQFTFKDNSFAIVFLLSLAAGVPLFHLLGDHGLISLQATDYKLWCVVAGALITGLGVAICGHVPETALASFASGRFYSLWVLLGMLAAFPVSRWASPMVQSYLASRSESLPAVEWLTGSAMNYVIPAGCLFVALFLRLIQAPGAGLGGGGK